MGVLRARVHCAAHLASCVCARFCKVRAERKAEERARRKSELEVAREREAEAEQRSYSRIMGVRGTPRRCTALRPRSR